MIKYSFIIPALNEEKLIGKTIRSIKKQEGSFEIIVIDNGSKDKTPQIAKELGCRVISEKSKGISPARNRGAKEARGEYLCFIDADGELNENWLEIADKTIKAKKPEVLGGVVFFEQKNFFKRILYNSYAFLFYYVGLWVVKTLLNMPVFLGNNCAFNRNFFSKTKGFEPFVNEDKWLSDEVRKLGGKILFNPQMVIRYSSRGFDESGFIRTVLYWIKGTLTKRSSANYNYKNKDWNK